MKDKKSKQVAYVMLLFGMTMTLLGLTFGKRIDWVLYISIPLGIFFLGLSFGMILKHKNTKKRNK